ncbi:hypothetical protein Tco_0819302 [Tanacetum coccineum]|uniref:Uncharacterized protein n=1 Tax=Tanacetum coccineum TaxID=301880 RepID=A0ABQ5A755_9ASTR
MDDPNITMEEYIKLQQEKAQRDGRTFNWQTATYGKVKYYEDEDDCFTNFESEFPAIVFDDMSDASLSCEPTASVIRPLFLTVVALEAEALELRRASLALTLLYLAVK